MKDEEILNFDTELNDSNVPEEAKNNTNIKAFISVFIVFLLIILVYFFIWKSIATKMKNIIADGFNDFKYDSISISGFPFKKIITINNINFSENVPLKTENYVSIEKLKISSFIFGDLLNITFKNAKMIDVNTNTTYTLTYNDEPKINLSFYSNGGLKSFNYSDIGYRVINSNNETLYTASNSLIDVESTKTGNTIDYSIIGDLQDMQNIAIINGDEQAKDNSVPAIYNLKFNISTSLTRDGDKISNSIIKIETASLIGNNSINVGLTGEIFKSQDDPYSYGSINLSLDNYKTLLNNYENKISVALNMQAKQNNTENNNAEMVKKIFNVVDSVIQRNPQTNDKTGFLTISREKFSSDYFVNGTSFLNIVKEIVAK